MILVDLRKELIETIMPPLTETVSSDPIRAAVWGKSGDGKTTLIGMMAKYERFRPIYFFDWDKRIVSLRARIPQELWPHIHSDPYGDTNIQGGGWTAFEAKMQQVDREGYKTVVIDSVTFMLMGLMNRVLTLDGMKPSTSNPQLQNYLSQQSMFKDCLQKLMSKKINVICTFHEGNDKDEYSGRVFKAFAITGKLTETVPGYFNEIWHCEIQQGAAGTEPQYMVRTRGDSVYMARTTYKTLDACEPQSAIWDKIVREQDGFSKAA